MPLTRPSGATKMRTVQSQPPWEDIQIAASNWIRAQTITPWIQKALLRLADAAGDSGCAGGPKVLAVFERSCYAGLGSDLLLCVGLSEIGRGPLNLLLDLPRGTNLQRIGLRKGDPLGVSGNSLRLGSLQILLGEAEIWTPPTPAMGDMSYESLLDRLRQLTAALALYPNPPGLGPLVRTAAWKVTTSIYRRCPRAPFGMHSPLQTD